MLSAWTQCTSRQECTKGMPARTLPSYIATHPVGLSASPGMYIQRGQETYVLAHALPGFPLLMQCKAKHIWPQGTTKCAVDLSQKTHLKQSHSGCRKKYHSTPSNATNQATTMISTRSWLQPCNKPFVLVQAAAGQASTQMYLVSAVTGAHDCHHQLCQQLQWRTSLKPRSH